MNNDIGAIEPFEICSIRPPTENYSLTFRLTRNCGWNRCIFCPVYKQGAKFSRRTIDEIKRDIERAKRLDELILEQNIIVPYSMEDSFRNAAFFIKEMESPAPSAAEYDDRQKGAKEHTYSAGNDEEDERLAWFASWFKDRPTIEDSVYHLLSWHLSGGETCFLGDANSLLVPSDMFAEILGYIKQQFPSLRRFTIYGRTQSAAHMDIHNLTVMKDAGLNRTHFGLESGSNKVLQFMKKGVTAEEHIEACRKTHAAGISCSVYVMPGLGGSQWSEEHGYETARVLTLGQPEYVRLRSLEVFPKTVLSQKIKEGAFTEATEEEVVREIRTIVASTDCETTIVSDSAANLLDVHGRLPHDRSSMLATIDKYLSLSRREKLEFSFFSRLQSFLGQYGHMSNDIVKAIVPYIRDNTIDTEHMSDEELVFTTRLIRSKLMP